MLGHVSECYSGMKNNGKHANIRALKCNLIPVKKETGVKQYWYRLNEGFRSHGTLCKLNLLRFCFFVYSAIKEKYKQNGTSL